MVGTAQQTGVRRCGCHSLTTSKTSWMKDVIRKRRQVAANRVQRSVCLHRVTICLLLRWESLLPMAYHRLGWNARRRLQAKTSLTRLSPKSTRMRHCLSFAPSVILRVLARARLVYVLSCGQHRTRLPACVWVWVWVCVCVCVCARARALSFFHWHQRAHNTCLHACANIRTSGGEQAQKCE